MTKVKEFFGSFVYYAWGTVLVASVLAASLIAAGFLSRVMYHYFMLGWDLLP